MALVSIVKGIYIKEIKMKKFYPKHQNTVLLQHNKTIKQQNNKTQNIKHISGVDNTTSQMTSSKSNLASTRGANASSDWVTDFYRDSAAKIRNQEIFYISASVKGVKSGGARREVNIDIIAENAGKPMFLKSFTVHKQLKWELFRDLPPAEKTHDAWRAVEYAYTESPNNTRAGKLITRKKFRTIPKFRLGNSAVITEDVAQGVKVTVILNDFVYEIMCYPIDDPFFMYRGDWKNNTEMEVV